VENPNISLEAGYAEFCKISVVVDVDEYSVFIIGRKTIFQEVGGGV
jgi:hypothetical protein